MVDPLISRYLIYIEDVLNIYLMISSITATNQNIYNVGSGKQNTIREIYYQISKLMDIKKAPNWNKMKNRLWDQKIWVSDMTRMKNEFDWKQKTSLNEGLKKTILWHKDFYY